MRDHSNFGELEAKPVPPEDQLAKILYKITFVTKFIGNLKACYKWDKFFSGQTVFNSEKLSYLKLLFCLLSDVSNSIL